MRIIFSRKGSDSSLGKTASPIFPDKSFCSLPIPGLSDLVRLKDIRFNGTTLDNIVRELKSDSPLLNSNVHFDPDLNQNACDREDGWLPCFGQIGGPQTELANHGVAEGDLFLFFGMFRKVIKVNGKFCYQKATRPIHALFGWLQIGTIYHPGTGKEPPHWAAAHPHVIDKNRRQNSTNTLYVASEQLQLPGLETQIPGGGTFRHFDQRLQLTEQGESMSKWRLPHFFYPESGSPPLSRQPLNRWHRDEKGVLLCTGGRGQEFVLDCDYYPLVFSWLKDIFQTDGD